MASERLENNTDNPWWGEHIHRYKVVFDYVRKPSNVLDIACGSGFGSYLLAQEGLNVIGGDISQEAIDACNKTFKHPNLKFLKADGTALPFPEKYFDAIVSFETIEHTEQYMEVLQEFKRTLKPEGAIFLSTPNRVVNNEDGIVSNPYHTQEWTYEELKQILDSVYPQVTLLGQQYTRYKKRKGFKAFLASLTENFFYLRGIRKLPLGFKDAVINSLIGTKMYPTDQDYELITEVEEIKKCKTFFAICKTK